MAGSRTCALSRFGGLDGRLVGAPIELQRALVFSGSRDGGPECFEGVMTRFVHHRVMIANLLSTGSANFEEGPAAPCRQGNPSSEQGRAETAGRVVAPLQYPACDGPPLWSPRGSGLPGRTPQCEPDYRREVDELRDRSASRRCSRALLIRLIFDRKEN